ncbi:MAG: hypothetical protein HQL99_11145 [Magnetococcales bacterium]|nr:hypothetical protein [Magnetococcales bacterium]
MNDYTPYIAAVYLLAVAVYGGYTLHWHLSWKRLQKQLDHHESATS